MLLLCRSQRECKGQSPRAIIATFSWCYAWSSTALAPSWRYVSLGTQMADCLGCSLPVSIWLLASQLAGGHGETLPPSCPLLLPPHTAPPGCTPPLSSSLPPLQGLVELVGLPPHSPSPLLSPPPSSLQSPMYIDWRAEQEMCQQSPQAWLWCLGERDSVPAGKEFWAASL